jgi:hypothetical protein
MITYSKDNIEKYLKVMNNTSEETKEDIQSLHIFYTLDKTANKIKWIDSRIEVEQKAKVSINHLISVLNTIAKKCDNTFVCSDKNMIMFIAENQSFVINEVSLISQDDVNSLFDGFEKLGIKIMLEASDTLDVSDSLLVKLQQNDLKRISIDGDDYILEHNPILVEDNVELPVSEIAIALGYDVKINNDTITLIYKLNTKDEDNKDEKITIVMNVGSTTCKVNGVKYTMNTSVTKQDGIIYANFDEIVKNINYQYYYDAESGKIVFE